MAEKAWSPEPWIWAWGELNRKRCLPVAYVSAVVPPTGNFRLHGIQRKHLSGAYGSGCVCWHALKPLLDFHTLHSSHPHASRFPTPRGSLRFAQMMWRLNFMVFFTCVVLNNSYMLYYICPMHTIFTVFVYAALAIAPQYNQNNFWCLMKWVGASGVGECGPGGNWQMGVRDACHGFDDRVAAWDRRSASQTCATC